MAMMHDDNLRNAIRQYISATIDSRGVTNLANLPLTVDAGELRNPKAFMAFHSFRCKPVEVFLDQFPFNATLLGSPGAGKTHALKRRFARAAQALLASLDADALSDEHEWLVPIYVDLKRYDGNVRSMLPDFFARDDFRSFVDSGSVEFLIDSYNEAPRQYFEGGDLAADLAAAVSGAAHCRWIIASRTDESLDFFDGERFWLAHLDHDFVRSQLNHRNADLGQRHADDLLELLSRPLFFFAFLNGRLRLRPGGTHPAEAIESVIESFAGSTRAHGAYTPNLLTVLGPVAASAIDSGRELIPASEVVAALAEDSSADGGAAAEMLMRWLVALDFFLAYGHDRVAFYHQSITEVLAARHIAAMLRGDMSHLDKLLSSRRWDESLRLVTHYLDHEATLQFFHRLLAKDPELAVRFVRFAKCDRHSLVAALLEAVLQMEDVDRLYGYPFVFALRSLPVDSIHASQLRRLLACAGGRGAAAATLLCRALGEAALPDVIDAVVARPMDYNLGSDAGEAVAEFITEDAIAPLFDRVVAAAFPAGAKLSESGVVRFVGAAFKHLPADGILSEFRRHAEPSLALIEAVCEWAESCDDELSFDLLLDLIADGKTPAVFPLYLRMAHGRAIAIEWHNSAHRAHFYEGLESLLFDGSTGEYAVLLIRLLCQEDPFTSSWLSEVLGRAQGVLRIALLTITPDCTAAGSPFPRERELWTEIGRLCERGSRRFQPAEYKMLAVLREANWAGHEELLLKLIELEDGDLVYSLLGGGQPRFFNLTLSWEWLEARLPWFEEDARSGKSWAKHCFPEFVVHHATEECRQEMRAQFNSPHAPHRDVLAERFLPEMRLTLADFTDESLAYLVSRLRAAPLGPNDSNLLGQIATHEFVEEVLLPQFHQAPEPLRGNLRTVLMNAEERLGIRYL